MSLSELTIGTHMAYSYASVSEADSYLAFDPSLGEDWDDLTNDDKIRRLVGATRRLDTLKWKGKKSDSSQVNAWPRTGLTYPDETAIASNEIPHNLELATIILAGDFSIQLGANIFDASLVSEKTIGPKTVRYFYHTRNRREVVLPGQTVLNLIGFWLRSDVPGTRGYAFGTDEKSHFEPIDKYGLTDTGIA